jgi:hypothetical protein
MALSGNLELAPAAIGVIIIGVAIAACATIPAAIFDIADAAIRADTRGRNAELRAISKSSPQ